MATLMGLLMESLFGIFQKKYMKMKKLCDWYQFWKSTNKICISSGNLPIKYASVLLNAMICSSPAYSRKNMHQLFPVPYVQLLFLFYSSVLSQH
jgi:hypothetical protein